MQGKIGTEIEVGKTISPYDSIGKSSAIDRTASNYTDAGDKVRKIRRLIETGTYDANIARFTPGTLDLVFQGMQEDIDIKEQLAHSSYREMENLDFQILLTNNYYTNPNSMPLCFLIKIKKATEKTADIDVDMITVSKCFAHFVKE